MPEKPTGSFVQEESIDGIAVLRMDDGKANALGHQMIDALEASLSKAEKSTQVVLLTGTEGRFCGGFDLTVMGDSPEAARDLVRRGAELLSTIYAFPKPVVIACTGHAVAAGGLLLLSADWRIGAEGNFRIGLPEVAIGLTMPEFGLALARDRLCPRFLTAAVTMATIYGPEDAANVGFLDKTIAAADLHEHALAEAKRLAALPQPPFGATKEKQRRATLSHIRSTLDEDMRSFAAPG